ncbi:class I SAM-dependent methyltransferase [Nonomuraea sp. SYSU D8015]|uniref:class I SAM-dependent methyltransferase n=1 Tax=Nonomuraea sp. SYSU D8015 TaxID=2593644 RepID=UPI001660EC0E|nr:methyltransferase domain-containing protein [Nonomuraea sp. SYSU D8015]
MGDLRPSSWGVLSRAEPYSDCFGYDRGTPIDRGHIEAFLTANAGLIRPPLLEVGEDVYARRFAGEAAQTDVVDIDPGNEDATLIADLSEPGSLPAARYRCVLLVQTLQYVRDPRAALANVRRSLAPGGSLLVTVPGISRTDPVDDALMADRWRFTPAGLRDLLAGVFGPEHVHSRGYGGLRSATAFLYGLAAEETGPLDDDTEDGEFPVVVCATARAAA